MGLGAPPQCPELVHKAALPPASGLLLVPTQHLGHRADARGPGDEHVLVPRARAGGPEVEEFLAFEREWLTGEWTAEKIVSALVPPLILGLLCLAFWKRSLTWGLVVINAMAVTKLLWGVIDGEGSGWVMLAPALAGLLVCNAVVLYAISRLRTRSSSGPRGRAPATSAGDHHPGT